MTIHLFSIDREGRQMRRAHRPIHRFPGLTRITHRARMAPCALIVLLAGGVASPALAQQAGQTLFATPEAAGTALFAAVESDGDQAMLDLLGPDGRPLISSGDAAEDAAGRATFAQNYREMHRIVIEPDGTATLTIGAKNWPTPIPLVQHANRWYFDTDAGRQEILFRRIGRNELSTIEACRHLAAGKGPAGVDTTARTPYRGYYFRALRKGGTAGGAAWVAYPADYRSSGVMTFLVAGDGVVYEKDLGAGTSRAAGALRTYAPDSNWHPADAADTGDVGVDTIAGQQGSSDRL
jgi:hypothetical protein